MKTEKNKQDPNKRTEIQKESDRTFIAGLLVKCVPLREIVEKLNQRNAEERRGYSLVLSTVHADVKLIMEGWKEERAEFIDKKIELELAKLDKMEAECWEAWERSKEGKRRTLITGGTMNEGGMSGGELKEREVETTCGDTKFLDIIQKCYDRRAALLGLNAPTKIISASMNGLNNMTKAEIEEEIEKKWKILS